MESMDLHQKAPKTAMTDMIPADVIMEGASVRKPPDPHQTANNALEPSTCLEPEVHSCD